jgi:hypothetical protein
MDLISTLAAQLGLDPKQAEGLAGAVLGQLQQTLPADQAASVGAAVPELDAWKQSGGGGAMGGILGALGGDQAGLMARLASLGVTPDQVLVAVPAILAFAKTRLPAPVVDQLAAALPGLRGGGQPASDASAPASLGGLLGGMFGK